MRLCSDLGLDSDLDLEEVGVTEIGIPTTILTLIHVMNIIIWGLGRKRRVIVARRHHIGFVCRAQFLVWVVRVVRVLILVLVLLWALVRRWLAGCRRVCCLTDTPLPLQQKILCGRFAHSPFPLPNPLSLFPLFYHSLCVCVYVRIPTVILGRSYSIQDILQLPSPILDNDVYLQAICITYYTLPPHPLQHQSSR